MAPSNMDGCGIQRLLSPWDDGEGLSVLQSSLSLAELLLGSVSELGSSVCPGRLPPPACTGLDPRPPWLPLRAGFHGFQPAQRLRANGDHFCSTYEVAQF